MKRSAFSLLAMLCFAAGPPIARGTTIATVSTGLDSSGHLITSGGVTDPHWTVTPGTTSPSGTTQTVYPNNADWYGGWLLNGPNSDWIARNASVQNNGPAPYTFQTTFDLTGYNLSTVSLSGAWSIDDTGSLNLNGHQISSLSSGLWGSLWSFSVPTGSPFFNQGLNTLSITITSDDQFLEAVRLQGTVSGSLAGAPEPASLTLLLGISLGGMAGYAWRRRGKVPSSAC